MGKVILNQNIGYMLALKISGKQIQIFIKLNIVKSMNTYLRVDNFPHITRILNLKNLSNDLQIKCWMYTTYFVKRQFRGGYYKECMEGRLDIMHKVPLLDCYCKLNWIYPTHAEREREREKERGNIDKLILSKF